MSSIIGVAAGAHPGLFRRLGRPPLPALHRNLDRDSIALSLADHFVGAGAGLLRAARHPAAVLLGVAGRPRAREFLRGRNFEYIQAARALGVSQPPRSCSGICCPTPWSRRMTFLPVHPVIVGDDADGARLPRLRPAARLALARRIAVAGQEPISRRRGSASSGFFSVAIMLSLLDLHRRGGARRLRSAQDLQVSRMDAAPSLARCERLVGRVPPGRRRDAGGRSHLVRHRAAARRVALVGESGSGKSVSALSVMKLPALSGRQHHPTGAIRFKGRELLVADRARACAQVRGNDISIIFQEPMTSLNPLHTIEKQIGEIYRTASAALPGDAARARVIELLTQVGIPDPRGAARQLSASAVRRPAPARDDRDGARQRARPPDRRRADDGARRHRAGADPEAAEGHPARAPAWACCSSPMTSASCARSPTASAS